MTNINDEVIISVKNLSKVYKLYNNPKERLKESLSFSRKKYHKEFFALKDISFDIKRGETVGIIGKNGSGKSTLLKIIAGVLSPTSGEVVVNGKVAALLELGAGFNPEYTGLENIYLQGTLMGFSKQEIEEKINDILNFADIGDFIYQPVKMYSSGMFVRLAFAVATQVLPDILIVDEALAVGDEKFQRKCYSHLESMRKKGTTILFVSHSMGTVEQLCSKSILLESGQIIYMGSPKESIDIYHERIYSLDKQYLIELNKMRKEEKKEKYELKEVLSENLTSPTELDGKQASIVKISNIAILDKFNQETYLFNTKSFAKVLIEIENRTNNKIDDIIVGFKIRTKQGVEVYGTSTFYHSNIDISLDSKGKVAITFEQDLNLVEGFYYLSFAVAKKNLSEMMYFDKKVDEIVLQIEDHNPTCTGIANLNSKIKLSEVYFE